MILLNRMKRLLIIICCLLSLNLSAQDSLTANYINSVVQKIEDHLQMLVLDMKDTLIYEVNDSLRRSEPLSVRTEYYFNMQTNHIEKIMERTRYKTLVTELTVYYLLGQPIRFTSTQWDGNKIKVDFDVFYMNNNSIYFTKRCNTKGKPDGEEYLLWCYELLRSHPAPPPQGRLR